MKLTFIQLLGPRYHIMPERFSETITPPICDVEYENQLFRPHSNDAADLSIGVASFCNAFPWHFVVDRQLELVQLGGGFMRLFGHYLNELGKGIAAYFTFTRPRGVNFTFHEILKRANTPFVLTLQKPPGADKFQAEVLYRDARQCQISLNAP